MATEAGNGGGVIIRRYAQIFGVSFLLVWILGLRSTADAFGVLNSDHAEDAFHLLTGLTLCYAGFFASPMNRDAAVLYQGVFYLIIGVYAFLDPDVFGLFPHELGPLDNIIHLVERALSLILVFAFGVRYRRRRAVARPAA